MERPATATGKVARELSEQTWVGTRREWSALLEAQAGQASAGRDAEGWQPGGFHLRQEQLSWMGVLAGLVGAAH